MKKRPVFIAILMITLLLLNFFGLYPNVLVVSASTIRRVPDPYPTIQAAIDAADPGDTILVAAGTYPEHVLVNKPVILKGDNRKSFITGQADPPRIVDVTVSNVEITGFTIQNGGGYLKGIYVEPPFGEVISNVTIVDNTMNNTHVGVLLSFCTDVTIENNTINDNSYGIRLHDSDYNTIIDNKISGSKYYGINVYARSEHNQIIANTLKENKYSIYLESSNNNILIFNQIKSSIEYGVRLSYSSGTLIKGNNIVNNKRGVYIWNCSGNTFYYNNFIENTIQVEHYDVVSPAEANTWDTDVCPGAEGNYWSDYTGVDNGDGVGRWGEPRVEDDGIGDTLIPHSQVIGVAWFGLDWYPLMYPWTPVPSPWPVAFFTYSPPEPIVNLPTIFNASESYDRDGTIEEYKWDFGDTTPIVIETGPITEHTFTETGTFLVTLTVTDNDGLYNSTSKPVTVLPYRLVIDVYTQKPDPYNGKGPNNPSDAFAPEEEVTLYAEVTYNYDPVENKSVSFTVTDPIGGTVIDRSNATDHYGIATTRFRVASNATFGIYTVHATVEISEKTANDTLTFEVGWIIEIIKVETVDQFGDPAEIFTKGDQVFFNLEVKNIAFTERNVTLTVGMLDERNQTIGTADVWMQVPPGTHELNLIFNLIIPEWALIGSGSAHACAFTNWPWADGIPYCPEALTSFYITAG